MRKHAPTMSPINPVQQRAYDLSMYYLQTAEAAFGVSLPVPGIGFDLRGTAAGQVRIERRQWRIRYNAVLLEQHTQRFLKRTVPHEVAHLVAYQLHGPRIRPHGREWKAIMVHFGADASRCHDFDTRDSRVRRLRQFVYQCACQRHTLSSIRHNRIERGMTYLCRKCQRPLTLLR